MLGDAQGRPDIGASLVEQMAEGGAAGFVGCFASPIALAATQAAAKYGLPFSIDSGIADSITTRGLRNVFRYFPTSSGVTTDAMTALDDINKRAGSPVKTVGHRPRGRRVSAPTRRRTSSPRLAAIGIQLTESIPHATPTRDFTNIVLRIKAAKPDLVVVTNYNNEYVLLARTLVQQRVDVAAVYSIAGGGFNLRFAKEQPMVAENIIDFNHWYNPKDPRAPAFRKRVEAAGQNFGWEVLFGYFAVRFLVDGMERAGSADKDKVIEALSVSPFDDHFLPYGPPRIENGQNMSAHAVALQIQDGDIKVIWPEPYAAAAAVFPRPKA